MNIIKRRDGVEGIRDARQAISDALRKRREAGPAVLPATQAAQEMLSARLNMTAEESAARDRAVIAASTAARLERNTQIQKFIDLKQQAAQIAAQAEIERDGAIAAGDLETAITAQIRTQAAGALPGGIDNVLRRLYPPVGLHF
jgi:hypothetical protein